MEGNVGKGLSELSKLVHVAVPYVDLARLVNTIFTAGQLLDITNQNPTKFPIKDRCSVDQLLCYLVDQVRDPAEGVDSKFIETALERFVTHLKTMYGETTGFMKYLGEKLPPEYHYLIPENGIQEAVRN